MKRVEQSPLYELGRQVAIAAFMSLSADKKKRLAHQLKERVHGDEKVFLATAGASGTSGAKGHQHGHPQARKQTASIEHDEALCPGRCPMGLPGVDGPGPVPAAAAVCVRCRGARDTSAGGHGTPMVEGAVTR